MYAKSFIALDGNARLTGARTAQTASYDRHSCHYAIARFTITRRTTHNVRGLNTHLMFSWSIAHVSIQMLVNSGL